MVGDGVVTMLNATTINRYEDLMYDQERYSMPVDTPAHIAAYIQAWRDAEKQIAKECKPQEVYFYEYNNFECMYDWDGDANAWGRVIAIFGLERAKKEVVRL